MNFLPELKPARLIKRYKRFLADVVTSEGEIFTLHCANTGAMTGCANPGDIVWYSTSDNPKRRYPQSWELTETRQGDWICVNTLRANTLVHEALIEGSIPELIGYDVIRPEVKYGPEQSRIDFLLQAEQRRDCYVEVKSVTLLQQGEGYFPDTVTSRGLKHLRELSYIATHGGRAVLLFAVLHSGIHTVSIAKHIDKDYAEGVEKARQCGVEILCYKATISTQAINLMATPCAFVVR